MVCLRHCEAELQEITFPSLGNATVHLCPMCEGAWYPDDALLAVSRVDHDDLDQSELAVSLTPDQLEKVDLKADVNCPVCAQTMSRFSYVLAPEIKIDQCLDHGTWLDDGELGTIIEKSMKVQEEREHYRCQMEKARAEMGLDHMAKGGSALNPVALSLRVLHFMFAKKPRG